MLLRALAALFIAFALPALAEDPPKCRLIRIAEWPVRLQGGLPIVEGAINGQKIGVLLDTGAYASLITKATAERLDLVMRGTSEFMLGFGGESRIFVTWLEELRIGEAVRKNWRVRVGGERPIPGVDFVLGDDFFRSVDVEFDYAKRIVRLFVPENCKGAPLAYWDPNALQVAMADEKKIVMPVKLNGRAARALLDSGASSSFVHRSLAAEVGITPDTPGVVSSHCSGGFGAGTVHSWVARFDSLALGPENIRDPQLAIADFMPEMAYSRDAPPGVILGTDFLRTHRVYVARSQDKVYFSYTGGLIFPATAALDCDDRVRDLGGKEALAAYDAAIAANPKDAKALLNRATLRLRAKDTEAALADLDAVIRLEPNNAVALSMRMETRATLQDYAGALADSGAAIANGMRTAPMYLYRAWLRHNLQDDKGVMEEYDQALQLDPQNQGALRARGRALFHADRFEAAEGDFGKLLDMRPSGIDSMWLALSRARRGLDGRESLERGLAKLKEGQWPAPVLLYLLGRLDREGLFVAAAADAKLRKERECEARFYLAEDLIAAGRKNDARPLLEQARDECPRNYIEYASAVIELAKYP